MKTSCFYDTFFMYTATDGSVIWGIIGITSKRKLTFGYEYHFLFFDMVTECLSRCVQD
jgi:hypothetical protein